MFNYGYNQVMQEFIRWVCIFQNGLERCVQLLKYDFMTAHMRDVIVNITGISQTIALLLVVGFWGVGFIEELTEIDWRHLSMWWYIKKIIVLILAKALIDYSPTLCEAVYNFSIWVMNYFDIAVNIDDVVNNINWKAMGETMKEMSWIESMMLKNDMIIPGIVLQCTGIFLQVFGIIRMLSISLLTFIAPISVSFCAKDGLQPLYRFLREYCTAVFQNLTIMLSIFLYTEVVNEIVLINIDGTADMMVKITISSLVLVGFILGANNLTKLILNWGR